MNRNHVELSGDTGLVLMYDLVCRTIRRTLARICGPSVFQGDINMYGELV